MIDQDYPAFVELWTAANQLMANGKSLSNVAMGMAFNALRQFDFRHIEQAINRHIQTAQFAPQPSDIIKLLNTGNERLSADEAWLIIPTSENLSAVWTDEMAAAWAECSETYYRGDVFSATRGFKSAYTRICRESELQGKPVKWSLTRGSDLHNLKTVVENAVRLGRLTQDYANRVLQSLPQPATANIAGLLEGKVDKSIGAKNAARARELIATINVEMEKEKVEAAAKQKALESKKDSVIASALNHLSASVSPKELKKFLSENFESNQIPTGLVHE